MCFADFTYPAIISCPFCFGDNHFPGLAKAFCLEYAWGQSKYQPDACFVVPGQVLGFMLLQSFVRIWEWLSPGGLPGLQNRWRVALRAAVGSTPIHSRLFKRRANFSQAISGWREVPIGD